MTAAPEKTEEIADMPTSPESILKTLERLCIDYTLHHHEAVFTVEESQKLDTDIPGTHCRNLFLRDKKKKNYLLVLQNSTEVDIKKLPPLLILTAFLLVPVIGYGSI